MGAQSGNDLPPFFKYRVDNECFNGFDEAVMVRGLELAAWEMVHMDTMQVSHIAQPDAEGPPSIVKVACTVSGTRAEGYTAQIHLLLADDGAAYTAERIKCSCPHSMRCKHAAALLLFLTSDWSTKKPTPTWKPKPKEKGKVDPKIHKKNTVPENPVPPSLSLRFDSDDEDDAPAVDPTALFFPRMRPFVSRSPERHNAIPEAVIQPMAVEKPPWRHRSPSKSPVRVAREREGRSPDTSPLREVVDVVLPVRTESALRQLRKTKRVEESKESPVVKRRRAAGTAPVTPAAQIKRKGGGGGGDTGGTFTWGSDRSVLDSLHGQEVEEVDEGLDTPLHDSTMDTDMTSCFGSGRVVKAGAERSGRVKSAPVAQPKRCSSAAKALSLLTHIPSPPHTRMEIEKISFMDMLED